MTGLDRFLHISALFGALLIAAALPSAVSAQEAGDTTPPSGIIEEETDGRRLGDLPNDQMRQFELRRACEEDLPECLPWVREQLEEERRNRMWMGIGIAGVVMLIYLLAKRESAQKRAKHAREMRYHRKLGARVAKKWRSETKDPYKDADPLGDK